MLGRDIIYKHLISRRAFIAAISKISLLGLLISRLFYMQCIKNDQYKTLSDKNRINIILIPPLRGKIYDTKGRILASNQVCFRLLLNKNTTKKQYLSEIELISNILSLSDQIIENIVKKVEKSSKRSPIVIIDQLSWPQIAIIEEYKHKLTHIFIDVGNIRFYNNTHSMSHIIGYTGNISDEERKEINIDSHNDINVGKVGIEKIYEETLRGEFGYKKIEVNAYGNYVRNLLNIDSRQGQDIYLSIDSHLQNKSYSYLNQQGGSAIVMDCNNGKLLLAPSSPSYDLNEFTKLSNQYWDSLVNSPYKPLINKIVQSAYPPGSVFKIITILAALEYGLAPERIINCTGASALGSNMFRCWNKNGHGKLDMMGAIQHSCNTYIYDLARIIGADKIIDMATRFGFGTKTGIDLPYEISGFVPSSQWKYKKYKTSWTLGDTLNLSMGQGFLLVTPIQLSRFITAIASNGKLYTPSIINEASTYKNVDIKQEYLAFVKKAMHQVVNSPSGTAYSSRIIELEKQLAGKTGTSQVRGKANAADDLNRKSIAWAQRNHALFLGFAPYHAPRYSVTVIIDHGGGGGSAAAPVASKIIYDALSI